MLIHVRWKLGVDAAPWSGKCALVVNKTEIANTGGLYEALSKAGGSLALSTPAGRSLANNLR